MAAWSPPRPLLMLLLLALLCSHIALCSSAAPPSKPKAKLSGSRKELMSSDSNDGDEPIKPPKTTAATKIKKKVSPDAKNQTKVVVKGNKSEPTATAKITKKPTTKAAGDVAVAKPKVLKLDKTTAAKPDKGAATAKPADKAATTKPKSTDSAKSTKMGAAKLVKSEGGATKAKKPSNSTRDAGGKPAKSTKKTQVVADVKANSKVNTTASKETAGVEEDVVLGEEAEGTEDLMSEFRDLPARLHERAKELRGSSG